MFSLLSDLRYFLQVVKKGIMAVIMMSTQELEVVKTFLTDPCFVPVEFEQDVRLSMHICTAHTTYCYHIDEFIELESDTSTLTNITLDYYWSMSDQDISPFSLCAIIRLLGLCTFCSGLDSTSVCMYEWT